jgi:hypothetical protein
LSFLKNHIDLFLREWKSALSDRNFLLKIVITPGLFFLYSAITQKLGNYVEMRKGILLNDKLLEIIPSFDFSILVFILLYSSLTLVILTHLHKPKIILRIIEMHFLVAVVRQICILCIALEPPIGIIVLRDIFLENTVYPRYSPLTKDLFFSGHVASIWLYFLCSENKMIKYYFGFATILMSFMILSMRVHYSYDIYGAFFFTTIIYFLPAWVKNYYVTKTVMQ